MAQKDIEQWAKMLQEAEAEDKAYEKACSDSIKEAEDAVNDVEFDEEDEVIDPASLGFIDSEEDVAEDDMLDNRPHNGHLDAAEVKEDDEKIEDDEVDLSECGFTEDGKELQEKEAEEDLNEDFHNDNDYASIELDIFDGEDRTGKQFAEELRKEVPDVFARPSGKVGPNPIYKITGSVKDLKEAYAFWLGLFGWKDVEDAREDQYFYDSLVYEDGDTIQEADYREALAHVLDPIGVKVSTANLKKNNVCQLSIVKEAVKKELAKRKMAKKALLEADLEGMSDEELEDLDKALDAGEAVDNGDSTEEEDRAWLMILKDMGINSIEEYKAMDPAEFNKRWDEYIKPLDQANGFARSSKVYRAYHKPDKEQGGATYTDFSFNPDYYRRVTRAEAAREQVKAEKRARENAPVEFPKRGQDTWSLTDFGRMLHSLGPKKAKELQKVMLDIAHEDNKDNPEAEAREIMFIKKLFGQKMPTFRDIARAWYPGQDPNTRQQSVNKFCQDTFGNFYQATREATGSSNGGLANFRTNVLGNDRNFRKFLDVMKGISDKRAANKRSIINKGKKPEETDVTAVTDAAAETPAATQEA